MFKPLFKRILVKEIIVDQKTSSGIILSTSEEEKTHRCGEVIAISNKTKSVKVGDHVVFNRYAGTPYQEYLILNSEDDIMGTYNSDK